MADEATSAIDALFDGAPAPDETATRPEDTRPPEGDGPSEEFLKTLHGADGAIDGAKAAKMAWDNKRAFAQQAARLAELEKAREPAPDSVEGYLRDFDRAALKEKAPRAFLGNEADEEALKRAFEAARANGMSVKQAQGFVADYYGRLNELLPEPDTRPAAERSKAAREAAQREHPNGTLIAGDVQAWLSRRHATEAFSEKELGVIGGMLETPEGLGLLWRLSRQGRAAPADLGGHRAISDPDEERRKTFEALGTLDQAEWNRNKDAIIARYKRARPELYAS